MECQSSYKTISIMYTSFWSLNCTLRYSNREKLRTSYLLEGHGGPESNVHASTCPALKKISEHLKTHSTSSQEKVCHNISKRECGCVVFPGTPLNQHEVPCLDMPKNISVELEKVPCHLIDNGVTIKTTICVICPCLTHKDLLLSYSCVPL